MLSPAKSPLFHCFFSLFVWMTLHPAALSAQWSQCCDDVRLELIRMAAQRIEFDQRRNTFLFWKQQERRNVPVYNARLNGAVLGFHKHIVKDEHYLVTNCEICRKYLKEIKSFSKKLDQAMR